MAPIDYKDLLQIASYFGWPDSTTHAINGALLGFGAVVGGDAGEDATAGVGAVDR